MTTIGPEGREKYYCHAVRQKPLLSCLTPKIIIET